ncbi:MAG: hypothetical protein K0S09_549 [Sphingobacteriaceae bacterium]|jgi:uncharacterized membrane protein YgdD (TMEM256/DUF423 family)|nr:hypothetical protein [Sphingobacteriaceae bacterium]
MNRQIVVTAAVFGIIAVILGAFGAHGLKDKISLGDLENWKTAVSYQFYHTLALLFLANYAFSSRGMANASFYCFVLGILLFSGSLYLLATRSITGFSGKILGPITPLGGLFFILGWIFLLVAAVKKQ